MKVIKKPIPQAHVENLEHFLKWLKTSENYFIVSSMSGGFVHVKFLVPVEFATKENER
jgi:hypothetical protein